jgi:anionic cell wall polymer biosynthesis LytR-Cps2A-Psr (LCP) family protein
MQSLKEELVSVDSILKLPRVAGILRGYLNTNMPDSALVQSGLNFGIRGDKNVDSITLPIKGTYQDIQSPTDGSALEIDKEKNKEAVKKFLDE